MNHETMATNIPTPLQAITILRNAHTTLTVDPQATSTIDFLARVADLIEQMSVDIDALSDNMGCGKCSNCSCGTSIPSFNA